jgi:hypothetical protein
VNKEAVANKRAEPGKASTSPERIIAISLVVLGRGQCLTCLAGGASRLGSEY